MNPYLRCCPARQVLDLSQSRWCQKACKLSLRMHDALLLANLPALRLLCHPPNTDAGNLNHFVSLLAGALLPGLAVQSEEVGRLPWLFPNAWDGGLDHSAAQQEHDRQRQVYGPILNRSGLVDELRDELRELQGAH